MVLMVLKYQQHYPELQKYLYRSSTITDYLERTKHYFLKMVDLAKIGYCLTQTFSFTLRYSLTRLQNLVTFHQ